LREAQCGAGFGKAAIHIADLIHGLPGLGGNAQDFAIGQGAGLGAACCNLELGVEAVPGIGGLNEPLRPEI